MVSIYRAKKPSKDPSSKTYHPHNTMRPPGNIPYIVDNLWEWKRPAHFPNRRYSAFASPDPELAVISAGYGTTAFIVEFMGDYNVCQLQNINNPSDSKYHPECKDLKKLLIKEITNIDQDFFNKPMPEKNEISALWMPCLTKEEVENLFDTVPILKKIKATVFDTINYWNDVALLENVSDLDNSPGEIFFEYPGGYKLNEIIKPFKTGFLV